MVVIVFINSTNVAGLRARPSPILCLPPGSPHGGYMQAQPLPALNEEENMGGSDRKSRSTLISRNITLKGHRTSMRLEPAMWDALIDICRREKLNLHQLCSIVVDHKGEDTSFTAAVRVFAMSYFRASSTEDGHRQAGHGSAFLFSAKRDFAALGGGAASVAAPQNTTPVRELSRTLYR
jgi:predicted DNA-binding ribbon-helix-helix protein